MPAKYLTTELLITFIFLYSYIVCVESKPKSRYEEKNKKKGGATVTTAMRLYPYGAVVLSYDGDCGGFILNGWSVVTPAHCYLRFLDLDYMLVQVGSRYQLGVDSQLYEIKSLISHEGYNPEENPYKNNIAILFLKKHLLFGELVKKAILVNDISWMDPDEPNLQVHTWKFNLNFQMSSNWSLTATHMNYMPNKECSTQKNVQLSEDMFCLYRPVGMRDYCAGDSGGAVTWNKFIVGLTTPLFGCKVGDGVPEIFTNIVSMRNWLKNKVYQAVEDVCHNRIKTEREKLEVKLHECRVLLANNPT